MEKEIWFDMDGTIADFYAVEGWLDDLVGESVRPYVEARPLLNLQALARVLHRLQRNGYAIGIVSWTSKNSTDEFHEAVQAAKMEWLERHLASVEFEYIDIVRYGSPKSYGREGILFDDEEGNRKEWMSANSVNLAFDESNIIEILKGVR